MAITSDEPTYPLPSTAAHTFRIPSQPLSSLTPSLSSQQPPHPNPRYAKLQTQNQILQTRIITVQTDLHNKLAQLRAILPSTPTTSASSAVQNDDDTPSDTEIDKTTLAQAEALVRKHIKLLHEYNEIKDIGMGLIGLIADRDGKRLGDVMADYGIDEGD